MINIAVIYARVSRAYSQDDDRVTIEAQLADCRAYCQERGYQVAGEFIDKERYRVRGKLIQPSGTRKDRPGYRALLRVIKDGKANVIVAWKEDRLYRGMYAAMPLSEILDSKRDITVELVKETFDPKMLGIKAAIAKIELDNIRDRMIMGRRARIERGEVPGGPVRYGYSKDESNRLVINEGEATVVRMVYDMYVQGKNNMEIRRLLNTLDMAPRVSKVWSKATIHNILTFEGYATGHYTTRLDGDEFTIPCPPIIAVSTWEKALEVRERNKVYRGRNVKEDYLCRGMVVCLCGWQWGARTSHSNKKYEGKWGYYACAKRDHKPEEIHPDCPGTIGSKKLDDFVWDFFVSICNNPQYLQAAIDTKIAHLLEERGQIEVEVEQLQRELNSIEEERHWVISMARKGKINENDMEMQLAALEFQALDLRKKREQKLFAIELQHKAESLKAWTEQYLSDITEGLEVLETDVTELGQEEQDNLYLALEASRFIEKYNGDKLATLQWAILEEKRRIVRLLISEVLVVKGKGGKKKIIPKLAFEIPIDFASLVYDDQSLEYVEEAKVLSRGD